MLSVIYPLLSYQVSPRTLVRGGLTVGSPRKFTFGVSQLIRQRLLGGIQSTYCAQLNRLYTSFTLSNKEINGLSLKSKL